MKNKRVVLLTLSSVVLSLLLGNLNVASACYDGNRPGQGQLDWLVAQHDPATGLMNSFEDGKDFAWTFDQALAVIAFTHAGERQRAKRILDKMKELQPSDCNASWNEWYRLADPCNLNWDWGSQKYVTGPIAWMVIAINYYEWNTKDRSYADMARQALCWLDTMKVTYPDGALRFCSGPRCGESVPGEPNWISTEHNIDTYSAYFWRGLLDHNPSYIATADGILEYLRKQMWSLSPGANCCRTEPVFCRGWNDCIVATDCQSWAVLALGPIGPDREQFFRGLYWLLDLDDSMRNLQDYNESITEVDGYKCSIDQMPFIEVDFTEHVAAAFYSIGDCLNGDYFHNQMGRIVDANGGLVHSFSELDSAVIRWPDNHRYNYVGSVAWYYFSEVKINPFVPLRAKRWHCPSRFQHLWGPCRHRWPPPAQDIHQIGGDSRRYTLPQQRSK